MYDTIFCGYDLGPGFHNKELHTKNLSNTCETLWLDPSGRFWTIDYNGTQTFTGDFPFYQSLGNHGKVSPLLVDATIEVFPAKWTANYVPYPRLTIEIEDGMITGVKANPA